MNFKGGTGCFQPLSHAAKGSAMDALLAPDEGPAVEVREGGGGFVVVCEHASRRLPKSLGDLGLAAADLTRHIAWDPGAADVARRLAGTLDADLVLQRFSRLVVDCNRDPALPSAFVTVAEDTTVPGNLDLVDAEKARRMEAIWTPFHAAVDRLLDRRREAGRPSALVTVHSFTPVFRGESRPWHVGFVSTEERSFTEAMLSAMRRDRSLVVGDNQPYSAKDDVDYTIRRHGRERGVPSVMIEVRNDLLADEAGRSAWAERLSLAIGSFEAEARAA
jgi:predicted N-formylglutamate amidohydrolase